MIGKYDHFGVPTTTTQEKETLIEGIKTYVTSPDDHAFRVEFLRFEEGCPLPKELQTMCHTAFIVDDLAEAMKGYKVILEPFNVTESLKCAFIMDDKALIELMEVS